MKLTSLAASAAALAFLIVPPGVSAQGSPSPTGVQPGAYKVEPYHTQVVFSVRHIGFTDFSGFFSGASGSLRLDPAQPAASKLEVTIPLSSALTTVPKLDEELKGAQWFDTAKFPTATFTSSSITKTGPDSADIHGDLTLHGVTRPVELKARFIGAGVNPLDHAYTIGFTATGVVRRSEFGVKTYVPMVGDEVQLKIAGAFEKVQ
ncbi:MAG TPA: YceI family protein [Caulobacteraceae bacterium]|jgi:polyisoprenoid-binding protein YceI